MRKDPVPDTVELGSAAKEAQYVHGVYAAIAGHFSATRYKQWPCVHEYLESQATGSVGVDIGCGNGKYLGASRRVHMVGVDYSRELAEICGERGFDSMVGDGLALPLRSGAFDFAISIAVVHHFASEERRVRAVQEALRVVRPGGTALLYVWALEQQGRRRFGADTQDYLVPWVVPGAEGGDAVYQRYYHLFRKGELEALVEKAGGCTIAAAGYENDNHWIVAQRDGSTAVDGRADGVAVRGMRDQGFEP
ncbi:tRNA methyltransferase, has a role in tRNA modification [Coemansia spiralis]|nr:tRNA methyltransferase, has a role in tRNA modification [Coemansia spiralis]